MRPSTGSMECFDFLTSGSWEPLDVSVPSVDDCSVAPGEYPEVTPCIVPGLVALERYG